MLYWGVWEPSLTYINVFTLPPLPTQKKNALIETKGYVYCTQMETLCIHLIITRNRYGV